MELIFIIIANFIFVAVLGMTNGWISKQLQFMSVKKGADSKRLEKLFKGQWHNLGMLPLRILVPIGFAYMLDRNIYYSFLGLGINLFFYDSIIDWTRFAKFSLKFIGTCETWGDFDCVWIKLRDRGLNHLVVKAIVLAFIVLVFNI